MAWGRYRPLLAQKTTVYCLRGRARGGPQLDTQAPSQRLVDDEPVTALAVGPTLEAEAVAVRGGR
jgi:hypothetical protein